MKTILITGGTGLIGSRLSQLLEQKGYRVIHLSRRPDLDARYPAYRWNVKEGYIDDTAFMNADAIIHLAGAGIADKRWTAARKRELIDSRVQSSQLLYDYLQKTPHQVKTVVAASAVGYYGNRYTEQLTETAAPTNEFLSRTTQMWESANSAFTQLGIRTVYAAHWYCVGKRRWCVAANGLAAAVARGCLFWHRQTVLLVDSLG